MTVDDKSIVLASGAADSSAANGAGIEIDGASATFQYAHTGTKWVANKDLQAEAFIKNGGTSSQFLKADGSVDSSAYITSADGSDAATLGGIVSTSFLRSDIADIKTSGNLKFNDGVQLRFGTDNDLQLYHSGTASMIVNTGTGNLRIRNTVDAGDVVIQTDDGSGGNTDYFRADGSTGEETILYHFGNQKLNTTGYGVTITGGIHVSGISTFQSHVHLGDDDELRFGAGDDFKIVHDPDDCRFENSNGDIKFKNTGSYFFFDEDGGETLASFINDGGVNLYHGGNKKLETLGYGVSVTGGINVSGIATATDFNSASDENLKTNIRTIEDPLAKVVQIRGVNFDWKETQRPALGVVAQEVEKVLPELVTDNGTKTVNYNGLIGLLIELSRHNKKR